MRLNSVRAQSSVDSSYGRHRDDGWVAAGPPTRPARPRGIPAPPSGSARTAFTDLTVG
jgi:hypothetical protein